MLLNLNTTQSWEGLVIFILRIIKRTNLKGHDYSALCYGISAFHSK